MNVTRIALGAPAAFVAYFIVGGIFSAIPAFAAEFDPGSYPETMRTLRG